MNEISNELKIWEKIMMTAIDARDKFAVGTEGNTNGWAAVNELQTIFQQKFGRRFTYGTISND